MNKDRIVALVALVAALLAGSGLPSKLGMTPQMVTIVGGLLVGLAAVARALLGTKWSAGERPNWRDILGAFMGVVAIGLGIDGVAVDRLDPDVFAGLSSLAAMLFAWQRGGGGGPTPPATTGLVLLVCSYAVQAERDGTCAEYAAWNSDEDAPDVYREVFAACEAEVNAGRDVCMSRRGSFTNGCVRVVPGRSPR